MRDLLPRVQSKFVQHGEILFPAEERPEYEHPKIVAAREAELAKLSKKRRKKKKEPKPD